MKRLMKPQIHNRCAVSLVSLALAACGTFTLGTAQPQAGKTADQQQSDTLYCKDQAHLAASTAGQQTEAFLLGLTIIGTPIAYEHDKATQREAFAKCMQAKGYVVQPPSDQAPSSANAAPVPPKAPYVTSVRLNLPAGWQAQPLPENLAKAGWQAYTVNRNADVGALLSVTTHDGITDMKVFAQTRRAALINSLTDAVPSEISQIDVNGRRAFRASVTGKVKAGQTFTYLGTVIEGPKEIAVLLTWTFPANFDQQKDAMGQLAESVVGF
jgi:hypothetical protein